MNKKATSCSPKIHLCPWLSCKLQTLNKKCKKKIILVGNALSLITKNLQYILKPLEIGKIHH